MQSISVPVRNDELCTRRVLSIAVDSSNALLKQVRIPRNPSVNDRVGFLKVPADITRLIYDENPAVRSPIRLVHLGLARVSHDAGQHSKAGYLAPLQRVCEPAREAARSAEHHPTPAEPVRSGGQDSSEAICTICVLQTP